MRISHLSFRWATRKGSKSKTKVRSLDILIDNKPLLRLLKERFDLVGVLGVYGAKHDARLIDGFIKLKTPLKSGRTILMACPECGDIGCGALTCKISKKGKRIIWKEFGIEKDYLSPGERKPYSLLETKAAFCFDAEAYADFFKKLKEEIRKR